MASPKHTGQKPARDSATLLPCFYFVELPIVASSMVSLYFLELTSVLQPAHTGFHCHDRALSMPYVDANDELIPLLMLFSLAFAGPAASIMIGEGVLYCMQSQLKMLPSQEGTINAGGCNLSSFLRRTVRFVGVHVFGLCATTVVADVVQLSTGYHTPFFLTVCKPNYSAVSCEGNPYITQDICSGQDVHAILSARKTFPSQHATISAFAAVYISMYFNSTISDTTKLLKPVLVFAFAVAAALTGLTQITQHRSHPIDVYMGFLIGAAIAVYLVHYSVDNFQSFGDAAEEACKAHQEPQKGDGMRALPHSGHDSVYHSGAGSQNELPVPPCLQEQRVPVRRVRGHNRVSADVEFLTLRSPTTKKTMITFSNTLPRSAGNSESSSFHHLTLQDSLGTGSSTRLVSQRGKRSVALHSLGWSEDGEQGHRVGQQSSVYALVHANPGLVSGSMTVPSKPAEPQLVHIPEEATGPFAVSSKSAATHAKWSSVSGKATGCSVKAPVVPVMAMQKQQGPVAVTPKSSETASSCTSSTVSSEVPYYRLTPEPESGAVVTVDAHAPHHPVVPPSVRTERKSLVNGSSSVLCESQPNVYVGLQSTDHRDYSTPPPLPDLMVDGHNGFYSTPPLRHEWSSGPAVPEEEPLFKIGYN